VESKKYIPGVDRLRLRLFIDYDQRRLDGYLFCSRALALKAHRTALATGCTKNNRDGTFYRRNGKKRDFNAAGWGFGSFALETTTTDGFEDIFLQPTLDKNILYPQ